MKRKNFAFRYQWSQAIAHLEPLLRLEIYEQTIVYALTGKACFKSGIAAVAFNTHILPDFERRAKAAEYRARLKERRRAQMDAAQAHAEQMEQVVKVVEAPSALPAPNSCRHLSERLSVEADKKNMRHNA